MIQTQQNQIIELSKYTQGLNTIPDFDSLTAEQSPDAMNIIFGEDGRLYKRWGRSKLNSVTTGATDTGYGLYDYSPSVGVKKLIAKFGTTVYYMNDLDGTYATLASSRLSSNMHCAQSRNKLLICEELCAPVLWWDGSATSATNMNATAPLAKYPIDWMGYTFLGYPQGQPTRFYYEDNTTLDTGAWGDYYTIRTSTGDDEFSGWAILKNRLYAMMKNSIHRVSYLGGSPLFDINEVITITGAVPRTIQNIMLPNGQEVIIFLNYQKKICIFDGTYVQVISANVEKNNDQCPVYLDGMNRGGMKDCHTTVDREQNLYHLFMPMHGTVTMTHRITLNYRTMAMYASSNQTMHSSATVFDSIGRKFVLASGYDGFTYKLDTGNDDSGTAIDEYYTSPKVGASRTTSLKKAKKVVFYFQPMSNYALTYQERLDFERTWTTRSTDVRLYSDGDDFLGSTFILGSSLLGADKEVVKTSIDLPTINNLYQYKITSNSSTKEPWVLNRVEFIEKELGKGSTYENTR